jgi:hypothetical protein
VSPWGKPEGVKARKFREGVAQKPIMAVSEGTKTGRNSSIVSSLPGWLSRGPRPSALSIAHQRRIAVITSTKGAAQFSTLRSRSMPL